MIRSWAHGNGKMNFGWIVAGFAATQRLLKMLLQQQTLQVSENLQGLLVRRISTCALTLRAEPQGEAYDAENRLASVSGAASVTFYYDGSLP